MKTEFTDRQLADPDVVVAAGAIRSCVHCGFCTATCPTYVLLGDERDSPRGRIYMIKQMLEQEAPPTAEVTRHIDRCLSCLSCTSTCPSGVDYAHLIDHARAYVEERYRRPLLDWAVRALIQWVLPHRGRARWALRLASRIRFLRTLISRSSRLGPVAAMLDLSAAYRSTSVQRQDVEMPPDRPGAILLQGCVEPLLRPQIAASAQRLIARLGVRAVSAEGEQCCGALSLHLGNAEAALDAARRNIDCWRPLIEQGAADAIIATASGCGTMIKDYGFLLRNDPVYAQAALQISRLSRDVSEWVAEKGLPGTVPLPSLPVLTYHAACSLQHGQQVRKAPVDLLAAAGFEVRTPRDPHLCCGSAGVYNILQPEIAEALGSRKAECLHEQGGEIVAAGNIGCIVQLQRFLQVPAVHPVELLDWATGGPAPTEIQTSR